MKIERWILRDCGNVIPYTIYDRPPSDAQCKAAATGNCSGGGYRYISHEAAPALGIPDLQPGEYVKLTIDIGEVVRLPKPLDWRWRWPAGAHGQWLSGEEGSDATYRIEIDHRDGMFYVARGMSQRSLFDTLAAAKAYCQQQHDAARETVEA